MSRLLVDTHLLLWLAEDSVEMPEEAARQLKDESHEIFFSVASIWEVAIKYSLGRKDFAADPKVLRTGLLGIGFHEVPITAAACGGGVSPVAPSRRSLRQIAGGAGRA